MERHSWRRRSVMWGKWSVHVRIVGVVPALFNVSNAGVNMLLLGWAYE